MFKPKLKQISIKMLTDLFLANKQKVAKESLSY